MKKSLLPFLFLGLTGWCFAVEDTPANRMAEVERLMQAAPLEEILPAVAANLAKTLPKEQSQQLLELIKALDIAALSDTVQENMVQLFTADELKALADLSSSPAGKSAMKKLGPYFSMMLPALRDELGKARFKKSDAPTTD